MLSFEYLSKSNQIKSKILILYLFQGKETACIELGKNEALIEGVVKIEEYSLEPGLGIEAARLLCSIVRNSKDVNIHCKLYCQI